MTITPLKERMQTIWNIPSEVSSNLKEILKKDLINRSWDEVLQIQKESWNIPSRSVRDYLDQETQKAYDLRYGTKNAPKDYSGRIIIDENNEWEYRPQASDLISDLASKLENAKNILSKKGLFRSLKLGLNTLKKGTNRYQQPLLSVEKPWNADDDQVLKNALDISGPDQVLEATHLGAMTETLRRIINKQSKNKKKNKEKIPEIEDFEEDETVELEEIQKAFNKPSSQKIIGYIWHAENEPCENCPEDGQVFLSQKDLPQTHPNCRCTIEPVYEEESRPQTKPEIKKIVNRNIDNIILHEEDKPHPYLDTKGKITVGCGKNVDNLKEFKKVNWVDKDGKSLSEDEKVKAYQEILKDNLHNKDNNMRAEIYEHKWKIYIKDAESKRLVVEHLEQNIEELRAKAKSFGHDFDQYPPSVQDALLDMQYNMGGNFNEKEWPNFYEAWANKDFEGMAERSNREKPISEKRNTWTKNNFEQGAKEIENISKINSI